MALLGFLELLRSRLCRTHSRYSRDLDLSLASTNKDAQVRRG